MTQDTPEAPVPPKETPTNKGAKPAPRRRGRAAATPDAQAIAAGPAGVETPETASPAPEPAPAPVEVAATAPARVTPAAEAPAPTAAAKGKSEKAATADADPMAAALKAGQDSLQTQSSALAAYVTLTTQWTQHWQSLLGASLKLQQQIAQQALSGVANVKALTAALTKKDDKGKS